MGPSHILAFQFAYRLLSLRVADVRRKIPSFLQEQNTYVYCKNRRNDFWQSGSHFTSAHANIETIQTPGRYFSNEIINEKLLETVICGQQICSGRKPLRESRK